jgi:hypothetical protein
MCRKMSCTFTMNMFSVIEEMNTKIKVHAFADDTQVFILLAIDVFSEGFRTGLGSENRARSLVAFADGFQRQPVTRSHRAISSLSL